MNGPTIIQGMRLPVAEQPTEIVERKGIGHPDTICDAVMEQVAVDLTQAYLKACRRVLHFNADKAMLVAGQVACRFGGGSVISPMRLVMGDRATFEWQAKQIPVAEIAERAAYRWFHEQLPLVKPIKDLICQVELKPASPELRSVAEGSREPVANDTSAVVGYAPLTPTERLVFQTEQFLNSSSFKKDCADTGQDVKVLAVRAGRHVELTVAMPLLASKVRRESEYFSRKHEILRRLQQFVCQKAGRELSVSVTLNMLDRRGVGIDGVYLTLLGTSAESGDSGEVGRGNRVCGVISLQRPASGEAAAGKNPMAHVGKIYNVLAQVMAERLHQKIKGLKEVVVWLTSRIGAPVSQPIPSRSKSFSTTAFRFHPSKDRSTVKCSGRSARSIPSVGRWLEACIRSVNLLIARDRCRFVPHRSRPHWGPYPQRRKERPVGTRHTDQPILRHSLDLYHWHSPCRPLW